MNNLVTIQSKRITLRSLKIEDYLQIFEYSKNLNVTKFLNWDYHKNTEETIDYLNRIISLYKYFPTCNLAILLNESETESEKIIGTIGLLPKNPKLPNQYELGFVLGESWWGKGYAYEAANTLISFTNKNFKIEKILAYCATQNIFSFKLLEKLGMKREGIIKKHLLKNGDFLDSYLYSLQNIK